MIPSIQISDDSEPRRPSHNIFDRALSGELPDLAATVPPEVERYGQSVLTAAMDSIRRAPAGEQEETLNRSGYRVGQIVGAHAINAEAARGALLQAAAEMPVHNPSDPWTTGFLYYKISRSISHGALDPDPIGGIMTRRPSDPAYASTPIVPPGGPGPHPPMTDMGNAERFCERWQEELKYCTELAKTELGGWMRWNGRHWQIDDLLGVQELAKDCVRAIAQESPPVMGPPKMVQGLAVDEGKNLTAEWAKKCEDETRLLKMMRLARSIPPMPVHADAFDAKPDLFNVENGTIDLSSGTLRSSRRTDLLTQCAPVTYDADAQCPQWLAFLSQCMRGNDRLVEFLQTWAGYCLTGSTIEHKLVIHYGEGSNGKSTFSDVLATLMGPYSATAAASSFMISSKGYEDNARNDLAALRSTRSVGVVETNETDAVNEALLKRVTGGDPITARFLHREFFTFVPGFKVSMSTNTLPNIAGMDYGTWRRICCIEWGVVFGSAGAPAVDKALKEKLLTELPGILNWALEGCRIWRTNGLSIPPEIAATTANYRESQDILGPFIEECCVVDPNQTEQQTRMYECYFAWNTHKTMGKKQFFELLSQRPGIARGKSQGFRIFRGITISEEAGMRYVSDRSY